MNLIEYMSIHKISGPSICKPAYSDSLRVAYAEIQDETFWKILPEIYNYTQLSMETMWSLYEAVKYLIIKKIEGDFVECGVFLGGSMMLIAKILLSFKCSDRKLWLYDSFEGFVGKKAIEDVNSVGRKIEGIYPDFFDIVLNNMASTHYPIENCFFKKGDIEKLAPININDSIALLRLDTDTYFSTKAELEYFFPKLVSGGVLIVDDYGYSLGTRKATDEYFSDPTKMVLLNRINFTNRIGIK